MRSGRPIPSVAILVNPFLMLIVSGRTREIAPLSFVASRASDSQYGRERVCRRGRAQRNASFHLTRRIVLCDRGRAAMVRQVGSEYANG